MIGIKEKLDSLLARVDQAALRCGRARKDILLVAVTKGVKPAVVAEARVAGLTVFGENKVQEAEAKIPEVGPGAQWHMIGHLQTNKARMAVDLFSLIQSVDSVRLAKYLNDAAVAAGKTVSTLLEVNISGETQKYGFNPEEIYGAVEAIAALGSFQVCGLMGMAPGGPGIGPKKEAFKKLRNVYGVLKTLKHENIRMKYLSMGMSDDFEAAIEEGSNMIRIGKALFS